ISDSLYGTAQYGDYGMLSNGSCNSDSTICEPPAETPFPTYYSLQMLTHLAHPGDLMVSSSSANSLIATHAVQQRNGHLALMLINKDPSTTYNVTVSLNGCGAWGKATVYTYGQNSTAITSSTQWVSGSTFTISIAPYSTNTVVLP